MQKHTCTYRHTHAYTHAHVSMVVYPQAEACGASEMATMLADKLGDLTPDPKLGRRKGYEIQGIQDVFGI